jgi:V-type H+-transporting ATPase subunit d
VLIDTPVGPYFMRFLEEELKKVSDARTFNDVQNIFRDIKP